MGWDRGRYYTRSKKVNGSVQREYIGCGGVAELVAQMDAIEREQRRREALALRQVKDELAFLDAEVKSLCETTELLARTALRAAGFHLHNRGEWRRRREQAENRGTLERDGPAGPDESGPDGGRDGPA